MDYDIQKYKKYLTDINCTIFYKGSNYNCNICDINICGATIKTDAKLDVYDEFEIHGVSFPCDKHEFDFICSVRFVDNGVYICQFNHLTATDIYKLSRIIYEMRYN